MIIHFNVIKKSIKDNFSQKKYHICLIWLALFLTLHFYSKNSYAFDLVEAYESSLSYNAGYLMNIESAKANREVKDQAFANLLPTVSSNLSYTENYLNMPGTGSYYYHQPTVNLTLQQVVFNFAKFSQYTKSKYASEVADLTLQDQKQGLILEVANKYFDVLYAMDKLKLNETRKEVFNKQLLQAQESFEAGFATVTDINDARASYDSANADAIDSENDLINKRNLLFNLTGLKPELVDPLVEKINLPDIESQQLESMIAISNNKNLKIQLARKQLQMAQEDVNIAKAGHLPTVTLNGQYNYQGNSINDSSNFSQNAVAPTPGGGFGMLGEYNNAQVGLQVSIPIYSGGLVNSQVRAAADNYRASLMQLKSVMRDINQQLISTFWQVKNGVNMVRAQSQAVKSAEMKLQSDKIAYSLGMRNSIDLIQSYQNLYTAIQKYNQSRYDYLEACLKLKYLVGEIDTDYLKLINQNIKR